MKKDEKKEIYMRIYVSQSEVGKSDKEYIKERKEIIKQIKAEYGDDVEIIGSYVKDKWGSTDKAFFVSDWQNDKGCIKEHEECVRRGVEIIYDGLPEKTNREKLLDEVIAEFWTSYLGTEITSSDVCDLMILLKVAKNSFKQKHDNLVDIAGYAACEAECELEK